MSDDPSGVRPPPRKLSGWRRVFVDDFVGDLPLGSYCGDPAGFPGPLARKWAAYAYPQSGTPNWGTYCPQRTTSIHNGVMDIWLHTELVNGSLLHLIDAVVPKLGCCGPYGSGQLYGRYVIRFRSDTFDTYHASWLLWPTSENWPVDGEIDFPEGDFNGGMNAYLHWQGGTSAASQYAFPARVPMGGGTWHTAMIDWLPTLCRFVLDGNVVAQTSNASMIPDTPMRFIIQNGGSFDQAPNDSTQGHVYIDWVAIYRPTDP
jgi:Glycosyl hydrolases family 16